MSTASAPSWLIQAQLQPYIGSALQILTTREHTRAIARDASRNQTASRLSRNSASFYRSVSRVDQRLIDHYSVTTGFLPINQDKNRYIQLEAYDRTRVVLGGQVSSTEQEPGAQEGRYLNANWVQERAGKKWWIASQAPLPHTAHAFLSLLCERVAPPQSLDSQLSPCHPLPARIRTVVQLTRNIESGRCKAHAYFPVEVGHTMIVPPEEGSDALPYKVTLIASEEYEHARCVESTVSFVPVTWARWKGPPSDSDDSGDSHMDEAGWEYGEEAGESSTFTHLLYAAWPDHGVPRPEDQESLLEFCRLVNRINTTSQPIGDSQVDELDPPMIVGCSAGVGRTGSFIALCSLLRKFNLLESLGKGTTPAPDTKPVAPPPESSLPPHFASPLGPLPEPFKEDLVVQEVDALREQRPGMVQRNEQVLLIYSILIAAFQADSLLAGQTHDL